MEVIQYNNIGARCGDLRARCRRRYGQYRRGVLSNIGDCSVGVTPHMCNRVTNYGDMGTFFRPVCRVRETAQMYLNSVTNTSDKGISSKWELHHYPN